jgi:hypothetical protein
MDSMSVYIKREGRPMESEQVVRCRDRIAALELENAALWAYYRASEAWGADESDDTFEAVQAAREALRQYEDKP